MINAALRQKSPDFNQADECLLLSDCLLNLLKIKLILILGNSHAITNVINSKGGASCMSKIMAQLPYHYGVKLRAFPSSEQKRLIERNSDASRFIYNEMNGMNRELYQLRQVKLPIAIVQQRIQTLEERLKTIAPLDSFFVRFIVLVYRFFIKSKWRKSIKPLVSMLSRYKYLIC